MIREVPGLVGWSMGQQRLANLFQSIIHRDSVWLHINHRKIPVCTWAVDGYKQIIQVIDFNLFLWKPTQETPVKTVREAGFDRVNNMNKGNFTYNSWRHPHLHGQVLRRNNSCDTRSSSHLKLDSRSWGGVWQNWRPGTQTTTRGAQQLRRCICILKNTLTSSLIHPGWVKCNRSLRWGQH